MSQSSVSAAVLSECCSVCNGDYGDTGYHGVNEILVFGDTITASVAKLNEFYLSRSTEARKQYTMCHGKFIMKRPSCHYF